MLVDMQEQVIYTYLHIYSSLLSAASDVVKSRESVFIIFFLFFLPRCMQCRRGLAMRKLSVRLSVCRTRAWIVT